MCECKHIVDFYFNIDGNSGEYGMLSIFHQPQVWLMYWRKGQLNLYSIQFKRRCGLLAREQKQAL